MKTGPTLLLRTAYCLDKLRADQNIGAPTIYRRVCENQFERFGLNCMTYESVRDIFRGRSNPGVDPRGMNDPAHDYPWLFALELEFPGCTKAFFHPAFDLIWGEVESHHYWDTRAKKIPAEWIVEAVNKGRFDTAKEWGEQNKARSKRGRPASQPPPLHSLEVARLVLLRLPPDVHEPLFKSIRSSGYVSRRFRDPQVEANLCLKNVSLDNLAALMALLLEAEAITDWNRFHVLRRAVKVLSPLVAKLPECRRVAEDLQSEVARFCRAKSPFVNSEDRFYHGKPSSWLCHLAPPLVSHFEEIFGHSPD